MSTRNDLARKRLSHDGLIAGSGSAALIRPVGEQELDDDLLRAAILLRHALAESEALRNATLPANERCDAFFEIEAQIAGAKALIGIERRDDPDGELLQGARLLDKALVALGEALESADSYA